jgi:signal transduction histidine kinase
MENGHQDIQDVGSKNFICVLYRYVKSGARFLYALLLEPRAHGEDERREELVLNVVLWTSIVLWAASEWNVIDSAIAMGYRYGGVSPVSFVAVGALFATLLTFSKRGYRRSVAYVTVAVYFCAITFAAVEWGANLPAALLGFAMVITMSSVLVSTRFALVVTGAAALVETAFGYAEVRGILAPSMDWKLGTFHMHDAVEYSVMLVFTAVLAWLSNRQTEASLVRARESEHALAVERDMLEVTVEARTAEVKRIQAERVAEVYRFVEFGRLASGLYHDLANHVGAVNMTLGAVQSGAGIVDASDVARTKSELDHAFVASKRLQGFVEKMKRELNGQQPDVEINLADEVSEILQLMGKKAERAGVVLVFTCTEPVFALGNPLKIHQIITNLVSNAVDSYAVMPVGTLADANNVKPVFIEVSLADGRVCVTVRDQGCGIDPANVAKIFQPFFTTKSADAGSGIGLAHTKDIVEKEMHGSIAVQSEVGRGTTFTVEFPQGDSR